jgi:hypothetical protein
VKPILPIFAITYKKKGFLVVTIATKAQIRCFLNGSGRAPPSIIESVQFRKAAQFAIKFGYVRTCEGKSDF